MHTFSSCGVSSGSLFKVLREKLELKAPQERFKEQSLSPPRPVVTASHLSLTLSMRKEIWSQHRVDPRRLKPSPWKAPPGAEQKFLNINVHVVLKCSCFLSEYCIMKLINLYEIK